MLIWVVSGERHWHLAAVSPPEGIVGMTSIPIWRKLRGYNQIFVGSAAFVINFAHGEEACNAIRVDEG
jgi:hypothetical protein